MLGYILILLEGRVIPNLSGQALASLRTKNIEKGDWYFIGKSTIIKIYRFKVRPMLLPFYVTDWVFSFEICRKIDCVDGKYGTMGGKKYLYRRVWKRESSISPKATLSSKSIGLDVDLCCYPFILLIRYLVKNL